MKIFLEKYINGQQGSGESEAFCRDDLHIVGPN